MYTNLLPHTLCCASKLPNSTHMTGDTECKREIIGRWSALRVHPLLTDFADDLRHADSPSLVSISAVKKSCGLTSVSAVTHLRVQRWKNKSLHLRARKVSYTTPLTPPAKRNGACLCGLSGFTRHLRQTSSASEHFSIPVINSLMLRSPRIPHFARSGAGLVRATRTTTSSAVHSFPRFGSSGFGEPSVLVENGPKAQGTFSDSEMTRRISALRDLLAGEQLDCAVFSSIHNIKYFSDFLYCSFGRPYALVVTPTEVTSVSALIDGGQPNRRTFGNNVAFTDWDKNNFYRTLQKVINPTGSTAQLRIGVEEDHVPIARHRALQTAFPTAVLHDIGTSTMNLRLVKSAEEIALIKTAAAIADLGGEACLRAARVGVPEHEVAMAGTQAMVRAIAERLPNSEIMDTWTWFQSGLNTDGAHNPVTTRALCPSDLLSLNCFPMVSGYYVALERTMALGEPSAAHLAVWEANVRVHEAGLKAIRPGRTCGEVARELNEVVEAEGLLQYRTFGYGHSFGVLSHYYGREAGLELREDIETVLRPGHVVSMEPMLMVPQGLPGAGGYREHDILVIEEDGSVSNITGFPFGPAHNILPL